jgi:hypothetical protein
LNIYHIWADLKDGRKDLEFVDSVNGFLQHFKDQGEISSWRIMRRKFGFGPPGLGDFHIMIEAETLDGLDKAFNEVASHDPEIVKLHAPVFSLATNISTALYRDFPDASRKRQ